MAETVEAAGVDETELFASAAELVSKSDGAIEADNPDIQRALQEATDEIRDRARWHIAPVRREVRRTTARGTLVALRTLHLVELHTVLNAGSPVPIPAIEYSDLEDTDGLLFYRGWSQRRGDVTLEFSHGHETVPAALKGLCLQMAARSLGAPMGQVREASLAASITHSQAAFNVAGGAVIMAHEEAVIAPYRIVNI